MKISRLLIIPLIIASFFFFLAVKTYPQPISSFYLRQIIISGTPEGPGLPSVTINQDVWVSVILSNIGLSSSRTGYLQLYINDKLYKEPLQINFPGSYNSSKINIFKLRISRDMVLDDNIAIKAVIDDDNKNSSNISSINLPVKSSTGDWRINDIIVSISKTGPQAKIIIPGQTVWISAVITNTGTSPEKTEFPKVYINGKLCAYDIPQTYPGPGQTARIPLFKITLGPQWFADKKFIVKVTLNGGEDADGLKESSVPIY